MTKVSVIRDDILGVDCDCLILSANKRLLNSKGIDGEIIHKIDEAVYEEVKAIDNCAIGRARLTKCFDLPVSNVHWIIHAVPSQYAGGLFFEADLLRDSVLNSLSISSKLENFYAKQCINVMDLYLHRTNKNITHDAKMKCLQQVEDLARQYAKENPVKKIAMEVLGVSDGRYPLDDGIQIFVQAIKRYIKENENLEEIIVVCDSDKVYKATNKALSTY